MKIHAKQSRLRGRAAMPGSKSHTVRALFFGLLAEGESRIRRPLASRDTLAARSAIEGLGARVREADSDWIVTGTAGAPQAPETVLDVQNSGTTLYIALAAAALVRTGETVFTGDAQIRRRSAANLLHAIRDLGGRAISTRRNGCAPIFIGGPLAGGATRIECPTSQYLTSLLMACPFAQGESRIEVPLLHEAPYARMTLRLLEELGLEAEADAGLSSFRVPGGQQIAAFDKRIPADFSSATFFLCAAALSAGSEPGESVLLEGLDLSDSQGDKAVVGYLRAMGARIDEAPEGLRVRGSALHGVELDLNATPDALPAMAVTACFAEGETRLLNVPQAREKETDRIAVMAKELTALGGTLEELPDGLVIRGGGLRGGAAHGHDDHRVVMSLAVAGLASETPVRVDTAEAVEVTFPTFVETMQALGADLELEG
jgi:3-phosphoshikimate 1-carboxyvinyltransferase